MSTTTPSHQIVLLTSIFIIGLGLGVGLDRALFVDPPQAEALAPAAAESTPAAQPVPESAPIVDAPATEAPVVVAPPKAEKPRRNFGQRLADAVKTAEAPTGPRQQFHRSRGMQLPTPEQIEFIKAAWLEQQEQAYAHAAELLALDEEGMLRFKGVIANMNEGIGTIAESLVQILSEDGVDPFRPSPELQMRLMGEIGRLMAETYEAVGAVVPEEHAGDVQKLELMTLVNPDKLQPVFDLVKERAAAQKNQMTNEGQ